MLACYNLPMQSQELDRSGIFHEFEGLSYDHAQNKEVQNAIRTFGSQLILVMSEFLNVDDSFAVHRDMIPAVVENSRNNLVNSLSNYLQDFDEQLKLKIIKLVDSITEYSNTATRLVWEQVVVGHGENGKSIYETVRDSARESILRAEQNAKAEARGQKTSPRQPGRFAQYFVHTPATEFGEMIIDPDNLKQPEDDAGGKKNRRSGLLARVRQAYAENESVLNVSWAAFIGDFFLDALEDIDPTDFI